MTASSSDTIKEPPRSVPESPTSADATFQWSSHVHRQTWDHSTAVLTSPHSAPVSPLDPVASRCTGRQELIASAVRQLRASYVKQQRLSLYSDKRVSLAADGHDPFQSTVEAGLETDLSGGGGKKQSFPFSIIFEGREGAFSLDADQFEKLGSNDLLSHCSAAVHATGNDRPSALYLLLSPMSSLCKTLDVRFDGYTILPIAAWSATVTPTLQLLMLKSAFLSVIKSEGGVRLFCARHEELPPANITASHHFWDSQTKPAEQESSFLVAPKAIVEAKCTRPDSSFKWSAPSVQQRPVLFERRTKESPPSLSLALPSTRLNFSGIYTQSTNPSTTSLCPTKQAEDEHRVLTAGKRDDKGVVGLDPDMSAELSSRFSEDSARVEDVREDVDGKAVWRWASRNSQKLKYRLSDEKLESLTAEANQQGAKSAEGNEKTLESTLTESSWTARSIKACRSRVNSISSSFRGRSDSLKAVTSPLTVVGDPKERQNERVATATNARVADETLAKDVCRRLLSHTCKPDKQAMSHYMQKSLPSTPPCKGRAEMHTSMIAPAQCNTDQTDVVDDVRRSITLSSRQHDSRPATATTHTGRSVLGDIGYRRVTSSSTLSSSSPMTPRTPQLHFTTVDGDADDLQLDTSSCNLLTTTHFDLEKKRTHPVKQECTLFLSDPRPSCDKARLFVSKGDNERRGSDAQPVSPVKKRGLNLRQRSMDMLSYRRSGDRSPVSDGSPLTAASATFTDSDVIDAVPGWSRVDMNGELHGHRPVGITAVHASDAHNLPDPRKKSLSLARSPTSVKTSSRLGLLKSSPRTRMTRVESN